MEQSKKIIYADDLQKAIRDDLTIRGAAFGAVMKHLHAAPAADAVPVVHGRWEYGKWEQGHWVKGNERCRCSVCHRDFAVDNLNIWHGCPQCFAKMDLPDITDQTASAIDRMGAKAHGEG